MNGDEREMTMAMLVTMLLTMMRTMMITMAARMSTINDDHGNGENMTATRVHRNSVINYNYCNYGDDGDDSDNGKSMRGSKLLRLRRSVTTSRTS